MSGAIFLSAGVPDPRRGPEYAATADTVAITSAVAALVFVALGRRRLVWGGQPAITPMIWVVAEGLDVDYSSWVHLYQTKFFEDSFPDDNRRFGNVTYTPAVDGDLEKSLFEMRRQMFMEQEFDAAVFIGGMGGIVREYELFTELQPRATIVPVVTTGGATLEVARRSKVSEDLPHERDYVALMHRHLNIPATEKRFRVPGEQPNNPDDRKWLR